MSEAAEVLNEEQRQQFEAATQKTYKEQACFFLNAFWNDFGDKAEELWKHWKQFQELDRMQYNALPKEKKPETYVEVKSLDEFWSHKFLETIGKTLTAVQFRAEFTKIDANTDKRMSIIEFLIWEYKQSIKVLLSRPQGADGGEVAKAQELLDEVSSSFTAAQEALDRATATENAALRSKEAAVASEAKAKQFAEAAKKLKMQRKVLQQLLRKMLLLQSHLQMQLQLQLLSNKPPSMTSRPRKMRMHQKRWSWRQKLKLEVFLVCARKMNWHNI